MFFELLPPLVAFIVWKLPPGFVLSKRIILTLYNLEITLNVKQLAVKIHEGGVKKLNLSVKGPCQVTASMIDPLANVEVLNPDLVICNINKDIELKMTLTVEEGKGYVPSSLTSTCLLYTSPSPRD